MKRTTLLVLVMSLLITGSQAQKKEKAPTGFAITAMEKGGRSWKEVRIVDISTGQELKSIYQSTQEVEALNARTGKPVVKKDQSLNSSKTTAVAKKVVNLDQELAKIQPGHGTTTQVRKVVYVHSQGSVQSDKPFATNSAAMAYDKKHERLYYTPMGINQLRFIDLSSKTPRIYYFEDEPFGVVKGTGDAPSQITRMVIASDGNGYALSNDGNHLIRFTTGKKPVITDLGSLTDNGGNGEFSVHSSRGYGGDMIADASGNLYLITANRNVFKIAIESRMATYKGAIKGLPRGFSTNGAMVESGSKVIVASSESTVGYYRFDLNTLQAEKVSGEGEVFNASDLANSNLAFEKEKKKKEKKDPEDVKNTDPTPKPEIASRNSTPQQIAANNGIAVYPNPVAEGGFVKVSFSEQPSGKYRVQLLDLAGKLISAQEINVNAEMQVEEIKLPDLLGKGSYILRVTNEATKIAVVNKLVVQ